MFTGKSMCTSVLSAPPFSLCPLLVRTGCVLNRGGGMSDADLDHAGEPVSGVSALRVVGRRSHTHHHERMSRNLIAPSCGVASFSQNVVYGLACLVCWVAERTSPTEKTTNVFASHDELQYPVAYRGGRASSVHCPCGSNRIRALGCPIFCYE